MLFYLHGFISHSIRVPVQQSSYEGDFAQHCVSHTVLLQCFQFWTKEVNPSLFWRLQSPSEIRKSISTEKWCQKLNEEVNTRRNMISTCVWNTSKKDTQRSWSRSSVLKNDKSIYPTTYGSQVPPRWIPGTTNSQALGILLFPTQKHLQPSWTYKLCMEEIDNSIQQ